MIIINIAKEYTQVPGGRFIIDGAYSGEEFRDTLLLPRFEEAVSQNEVLTVVLDGGYGYGTSFLDEAFGGLARKTRNPRVMDIRIVSEEEPDLIQQVKQYIKKGLTEA